MSYTILDCYTDEPSGLGVPPYLGTYPRYLFGALKAKTGENPAYLTIDDIRLQNYDKKQPVPADEIKTNIKIKNLTRSFKQTLEILETTDELVIIAGVHTPGKYLSAVPGTLFEIKKLTENLNCNKTITGPASTVGTRLEGGKIAEKENLEGYSVDENFLGINDYSKLPTISVAGAEIVKQIPYPVLAEIETAKGCGRSMHCSFCTEPLKNKMQRRKTKDILTEAEALAEAGVKYFRIGKQADFFDQPADEMEELLKGFNKRCNPDVLHIDNVDPISVTEEKVKIVTKYCTPGNVAAFGVESFDPEVISANKLHSSPEMSMKAIRLINKHGAKKGSTGMPLFLPGINLLFGLMGESKQTHQENMRYLQQILDEKLLLRRINVRQVVVFPGTPLESECGNKFLRKNKKYYWKWRNEIRQKIDSPLLQTLLPKGTILNNLRAEIYDGNTTFLRQFGTYPLAVGVKKRLELNKFYDIRVVGHMLRSIVGEIV